VTLRRRSPYYVRQWSAKSLHAVLGRFDRERRSRDLSEAQEWLYDAMVSELEWRRRHTRPVWQACSCHYCFGPFPFPEHEDGPER
jgi:hypothetical protein